MTVLQAYPDNQGAQQILEKIKIDGHLISYFSDNPVSNTADCSYVHGSWMDVWQIRERGLHASDLAVILTCSSNLFLGI